MLSSTSVLLLPSGEWRQHLYHQSKTCCTAFFQMTFFLFSWSLHLSCRLIPLIALLLLSFPPLHLQPTRLFICLPSFSPSSLPSRYTLGFSSSAFAAVFSPVLSCSLPFSFLDSSTVSSALYQRHNSHFSSAETLSPNTVVRLWCRLLSLSIFKLSLHSLSFFAPQLSSLASSSFPPPFSYLKYKKNHGALCKGHSITTKRCAKSYTTQYATFFVCWESWRHLLHKINRQDRRLYVCAQGDN